MKRSHRATPATIALGILLACCRCAFSLDPSLDVSQYAHTSWKISEGFGRGDIGALDQTPDGYLWLGSEFGLRRFDGVRTVEWQPPGNAHLPSSLIRKLLVARDGTLWIGAHKGLASWKDGKLIQYPEVPGQRVDALLEDRDIPHEEAWNCSSFELCLSELKGRGAKPCLLASCHNTRRSPIHGGDLWTARERRRVRGATSSFNLPYEMVARS
ncbi:MAG TPA: hypothetical protein VMP68_32860 [Candidatus Eisenbacteria bacterium]|nr:hypothetical protein [Candidatus Eisenbacteria bacterium]